MSERDLDSVLVHFLIESQFPEWANLPIQPVEPSGWDNKTYRLGSHMLIRMPSSAEYASQVEKEQKWLPILAPLLPLPIPKPLRLGAPTKEYPWNWSIYEWLQGESASSAPINNLSDFATNLAKFLTALYRIDSKNGPPAGPHSFYRGASIMNYDAEAQKAIARVQNRIDYKAAIEVWETALSTTWNHPPVWVHGDISVGNLLVQKGTLSGVIDFGQLTIGDPACDLAIAWTLFTGENRKAFRSALSLDAGTWARGRAWALWKALITAAGYSNPNNTEASQCWRIIDEVLKNT